MSQYRFVYYDSGRSVYALVRNCATSQIWNEDATSFFEYDSMSYQSYVVDCTKQGGSGTYVFQMPAMIEDYGHYDIEFREALGSPPTPDEGDPFIEGGVAEWTGSSFLLQSSILASAAGNVDIVQGEDDRTYTYYKPDGTTVAFTMVVPNDASGRTVTE